jgi:hypothetical protein
MSSPASLVIAPNLWNATLDVLQSYSRRGVEAGCFWYGTRNDNYALASLLAIPQQVNRRQNFHIPADSLAEMTQMASASGLVAVAQIHTHPGVDVKHSPWDDAQIVSQNVWSLVMPNYGKLPVNFSDVGVHRFRDGRWRRLTADEVGKTLLIQPLLVDAR